MTISKAMITDTIKIAQIIRDSGLEGEPLNRNPENRDNYHLSIKPEIDKFENKYGRAPQQILNDYLKTYIAQRNISHDFISAGKQFYTQTVNGHTWACINKNDVNKSKRRSLASKYPQLYVLIDPIGLLFGFCYGFYIPNDDKKIENVKSQDQLLTKLLDVLKRDPELKVYLPADYKQGERPYTELKINNIEDLKKNWSKNIRILKIYPKENTFDNIEQKITECFDNLLDIFKFTSLIDSEDQSIKSNSSLIGPSNYWQIAPKAQASAWDLCIEKGIIPIYFNEYLQNLTEEVLDYNLDQLFDFCQKNNPGATKGQVSANVESIWNFIHAVQIGDYVLANKGKSLALGWGIIASKAKIFKEGEDITFYRDVDWKDTTLNRDLTQTGFGRNFFRTIYQMTKDHFESIINMTSIPTNPLYAKIQNLLDYKKQIILYGPPGTGKTWIASNFLKFKNNSEIGQKAIRTDKKFFWYSLRSEDFDDDAADFLENQKVADNFVVDDIFGALDDIEKGDVVFIYEYAKEGRLSGIATFEGKGDDGVEGTLEIRLRGVKPVQSLLWEIIEKDPTLKNSKPVQYDAEDRKPRVVPARLHPHQELWQILFPLTKEEGMRLLELARVSLNTPNISPLSEISRVSLCTFVTFHPSYAYEEFIEGLRPIDMDGNIRYEIHEGIFKKSCREALNELSRIAGVNQIWEDHKPLPNYSQDEISQLQSAIDKVPCYMIIDEINRGDISRIFGELITLIESDKRLFCDNEIRCTLPYSKMDFGIPPNLYIIGTLNTADRSISLMDIALRRRFGFIELLPDYDALNALLLNDTNVRQEVKEVRALAIQSLKTVNERLQEKYDRDHQIGHSYLMKLNHYSDVKDTQETLTNIWRYEIIPLLQEYFYDSPEKLLYITNNRFFEKGGSSFIMKPEDDITAALKALSGSKQ